jgi:mycothiol synthase
VTGVKACVQEVQFRAPTLDDAPAVMAVLEARDRLDLGAPDYTLEELREEWKLSEVDLARDALVAEDAAGRIVAYAIVRRPGTLAIVAPGHEGHGIGGRLLEWSERRALEQRRHRHRQWIAATNSRGVALLRAAGYEYARSYTRMARRFDDTIVEAGEPPVGTRFRPLDLDRDAAAIHSLDAASFSADPHYEPESFEQFSEEHLQARDLDPQLSRVALAGGEIVGFLLSRRWRDQVGFVDILAVHPDHQHRGIGGALLLAAFAAFATAGLREAQLGVASDNPRALKLYERAGMTPRFRFDTYERPAIALRR